MGALQGYFATAGIGSLIGMVVGWFVFNEAATVAPGCVTSVLCSEQLMGMTFLSFVTAVAAACGGVIGLFVQMVRGDVL